jgi:pSer/pThr/pTyr-binding forkhead associated (FHA) protein
MWILRTTDDSDEPLTFRLAPGAVKTIGRAARADFIVDRALVSRIHCRLTLSDAGGLLVEDLGSTNGTFLNGERVTRRTVASGDRIKLGRVEFVATQGG